MQEVTFFLNLDYQFGAFSKEAICCTVLNTKKHSELFLIEVKVMQISLKNELHPQISDHYQMLLEAGLKPTHSHISGSNCDVGRVGVCHITKIDSITYMQLETPDR